MTESIKQPHTRPSVLSSYVENMFVYLKHLHPEVDDLTIRDFIRNKVNTKYKQLHSSGKLPTCKIVRACAEDDPTFTHSEGNLTYYEDVDLLKASNGYRDKIISPSGSFFETADNHIGLLKNLTDDFKVRRKTVKKLMLECKKKGDMVQASLCNCKQDTIKRTMNSVPGAMGSAHSFLSSAANFNSVTSIGRSVVTNSYAHAERFLAGNFYFPNPERAMNFMITCLRLHPDSSKIEAVIRKHGLYVPSCDDVYDFILRNVKRYQHISSSSVIRNLIEKCSDVERTFIFYMSNLRNLFWFNETLFRELIDKLINPTEAQVSYEKASDIFNFDGDLLIVLSTVLRASLPRNAKGNTLGIGDCLDNAELMQKLYRCAQFMQDELDKFEDLFDVFTNHGIGVQYADEHKYMEREVVGTSDTDSILFTVKDWCLKYFGKIDLTADATYSLNSVIVYFLTKANEHILHHLSIAYNATGNDIKTIAMKNEFMMPVEMLTTMKKNYASHLAVQEGVSFGSPILDLKGVSLRGSNFSKSTLVYVEWMVDRILTIVTKDGHVKSDMVISWVLDFERMIYDSLISGETTYLTVTPVKREREYKDPSKSIYINYLFWEEVFGPEYGNISVPTKCFMVPVTDLSSSKYLTFLKRKNEDIYQRLTKYLAKSDKLITRIPINPTLDRVPVELRPIMETRKIVYSNTKPLYTILRSLGVPTLATSKSTGLLSDVYGLAPVSSGERAKAIVQSKLGD